MTIFESWGGVFSNLHEQFNWPMPVNYKSKVVKQQSKLTTMGSENNLMAPRSSFRANSVTSLTTPKLFSKREKDLNSFFKACTKGELFELALLLATMLLDHQGCTSLIETKPALVEPWRKALEATRNSVYLEFASQCTEVENQSPTIIN